MTEDYEKNCLTCAESIWIYGALNQIKCKLTDRIIKNKLGKCEKWRDAFEKVVTK